jgi:hypothetical protein
MELGKLLLERGERAEAEAALKRAVGAAPHLAGAAALILSAAPHGRIFLQAADLRAFLGVAS